MEVEKTKRRESSKGNKKKLRSNNQEQVIFPEKLNAANKTLKKVDLPK
ncbi:hypothetical protein SAMN04488029_2751 [Reichenbachiella faecimaris]|uniref:Uncharacterized protein n=1 Tax=Reichenbachiella faecimaris TaxID=692418 RepID=A0A1W2GHN0_REIFA|nr:hypothetical protein SAMN04488029_2751 [Reichenbachiella faecimaris]